MNTKATLTAVLLLAASALAAGIPRIHEQEHGDREQEDRHQGESRGDEYAGGPVHRVSPAVVLNVVARAADAEIQAWRVAGARESRRRGRSDMAAS